jgi:DNA-binding transcriptional MocR family regulator
MPSEPDLADGLLDLARGNPDPDLLPPFEVVMATKPVLYGDESFDPDLRRLAAASLASDGVGTNHLSVVAGALDGLERILAAHLRPGDRVAIEDPAFFSVIDLLGALGLIPVPVEIDDAGLTPKALTNALASGIHALVHTPRGQNPYGSAMSAVRRRDLTAMLGDYPDVLVVEDDFAGVVAGAPYETLTSGREAWAVIRSAAKTYTPDLRLACLAADETTVRRVDGRQRLGSGWVSHLLQRTVAALMADASVDRHLIHVAETYGTRRDALVAALADLGVSAHGRSGLNVWLPVQDERAAVAGMRERGIAVRSGDRFRLRTDPGIRVTTAALPVEDASGVAAAIAESLGHNQHTSRTA